MFDHETRLKSLEKEVSELKELVRELTRGKWLPLREASQKFNISRTVILGAIQKGKLIHLKDWKKNGNRYLVNTKSVTKIQ